MFRARLNAVGDAMHVLLGIDRRAISMQQVEPAAVLLVPHGLGQIAKSVLGRLPRRAEARIEDRRLRGGPGLPRLVLQPFLMRTVRPPIAIEVTKKAAMLGIQRPREPSVDQSGQVRG